MPRCLLLVSTTSYRTDAFLAAARRIGVRIVLGSDRCHQLAATWDDAGFATLAGDPVDESAALDYRHPEEAARQIAELAAARPLDAVVATDDTTAEIAALACARLGLPGNAPAAARAARDKSDLRERLHAAGVPSPRHLVIACDDPAVEVARRIEAAFGFPTVAKPLLLSASRGVLRVDDARELATALPRIAAILRTRAEFTDGGQAARRILVEEFIPGAEVALEGILRGGRLTPLAVFDKPDPLDGPTFEETLYVTPSRHPAPLVRAIEQVSADAARALGLREGPVHAELRLAPTGPVVIEVAARTIGGLCARTLRFSLGGAPEGGAARAGAPVDARDPGAPEGGAARAGVPVVDARHPGASEGGCTLEELVLRAALGDPAPARRNDLAAGVMMLPVPGAGVLREVTGIEAARAVPLIEDVVISARPGERLVPLPEGASYPGFVFARGATPADVEQALRAAHRCLHFSFVPLVG